MFSSQPYAAQTEQLHVLRGHDQIWRLVIGLAVIAIVSLGLTAAFFFVIARSGPRSLVGALVDGSSPVAVLILLGSFAAIWLGVLATIRWLHRRPVGVLIGPRAIAVRHFLTVCVAFALLSAVLTIAALVSGYAPASLVNQPLTLHTEPALWLMLLPLALLCLFVQISAEELLFRGYLQRLLAVRFRTPLVWLVLPSVVFGLLHYDPANAGENAGLIALWAGGVGLLMADLTARTGSLGAACAVHFVNNVIAILVFGSPTTLSGLALFLLPYELSDPVAMQQMLWLDLGFIFCGWGLARIVLRR
ncbi:type II CAAX endopeptidase family protein [Phaeobacter sp.]|uniref:CPBP family intramembrane glutamic endopeptidase n=1 Tax=Phaeobacter sp. TaxID=1902409 RepID=UPI0025DC8EBB|nr:type II CAAX endopeptidase family protein [Phaeobacter sp.]